MIIFALRHADRTAGDDLSPEGETRARLLAQLLGGNGVTTAFCSSANRAQKTLQPLKRRSAIASPSQPQPRSRRSSMA